MLKFLHDILSFEGSRDTSRASFFCGSSLGAQYKISKIKFAISMMVGSVRCIKHNYPDHRDKSERQKRRQRHRLLPIVGLWTEARPSSPPSLSRSRVFNRSGSCASRIRLSTNEIADLNSSGNLAKFVAICRTSSRGLF